MSTKTALLVIDVQLGMFPETDPVHDGNALLERIKALITKARTHAVPVIYVQHNEGVGEPLESKTLGWEIHPDIAPLAGDILIQKYTPDSFHETNLKRELDAKGIQKLVLTGIQTDLCVDATCRQAHSLGYDVTVAADAHSTWAQGNQSAADIIGQYNELLQQYADVRPEAEIVL